jgi:preprotein translocase subunit YajC
MTGLLPSFHLLQQAAPTGGFGGGLGPLLFQLAAISAIIYLFMIRPQQKQRKEHEERLRNLKRGDQVVTVGGLVGEVMHMKETTGANGPIRNMDDHITLKTGEARVVVERGRIARVMGENATTSPST